MALTKGSEQLFHRRINRHHKGGGKVFVANLALRLLSPPQPAKVRFVVIN
jgi:hypothetical protein